MYFVRLNGASLYGSFITETEVYLFLTRSGWLSKTGSTKSWTLTKGDTEYIAVLVKGSRDTEYITKDSLPKGDTLEAPEDLVGRFYQDHFQTV